MGNLTTPEALSMRWAELVKDPTLSDLPYKIEINLWGKVEMTPASFWHGRLQGSIAAQFAAQLRHGESLTEVPILTEIGVRAPDVGWGSKDYLEANANAFARVQVERDLERDFELPRAVYFWQDRLSPLTRIPDPPAVWLDPRPESTVTFPAGFSASRPSCSSGIT